MPGCRKSVPFSVTPPQRRGVSAAHYVVSGRQSMRAANDNPRLDHAPSWYWAVVIGALPTVCVVLILSMIL